jgi:hypothetical protein
MKTTVRDTLVVTKESLTYLRNFTRKERGFTPTDEASQERYWKRYRKFNTVDDNNVRVDYDTFSKSVELMKDILTKANLQFKEDGVKIESMSL